MSRSSNGTVDNGTVATLTAPDAAPEIAPAVDAAPAPENVTAPEPFTSEPDYYGADTSARGNAYSIDVRKPYAGKVRTEDGKGYKKNADGTFVKGAPVTLAQMQRDVAAKMLSLPGARIAFNGTIDYTAGARVRVTWTENRVEYTRIVRKVYAAPDASRKRENAALTFAFKMADGTFKQWHVIARNLLAVESVD